MGDIFFGSYSSDLNLLSVVERCSTVPHNLSSSDLRAFDDKPNPGSAARVTATCLYRPACRVLLFISLLYGVKYKIKEIFVCVSIRHFEFSSTMKKIKTNASLCKTKLIAAIVLWCIVGSIKLQIASLGGSLQLSTVSGRMIRLCKHSDCTTQQELVTQGVVNLGQKVLDFRFPWVAWRLRMTILVFLIGRVWLLCLMAMFRMLCLLLKSWDARSHFYISAISARRTIASR